MIGQLLTLEGYPSLPFLLWLADRALDARRAAAARRDFAALALGTAFIVMAGHPQLPAYAVAATLLYILWCGRGWLRVKLWGAMAAGIGATFVVWWPMLLLIRRSTRVLALDPASNDIPLPYHRLLGLIVPGIDGWPAGVGVPAVHPFNALLDPAYFWDTFAYVGIMPWIAVLSLCAAFAVKRRLPSSRWMFLIAIGAASLMGSLPWLEPLRRAASATILRSPARLLYLCTFVLSIGFGAGLDALLRWNPFGRPIFAQAVIVVVLGFHAWDLGGVARLFILPVERQPQPLTEFAEILAREAKDSRVAISRILSPGFVYEHDDPGGYDSIFLADTYRAHLAAILAPAGLNTEVMDAAAWPPPALSTTGVRFVVTWDTRTDLEAVAAASGLHMYRVVDPAPLASFRPMGSGVVAYTRPDSDEVEIDAISQQPAFVSLLEAFDPGWGAEVDGIATPVTKQDGFKIGVPVSSGHHTIRLRYHTPGRGTGALISAISVVLAAAYLGFGQKQKEPEAGNRQILTPGFPISEFADYLPSDV